MTLRQVGYICNFFAESGSIGYLLQESDAVFVSIFVRPEYKKIAQGCQGGTRRILAPYTTTFSKKIAYIPNLTVLLCFYSTILSVQQTAV